MMRDNSGCRSRSFAADSICRRRTGSTLPTRGWRRSVPIVRTSSERALRPQTRRTTASRRRCAGIPCSRRSMLAPVVAATVSQGSGKYHALPRFQPGGSAASSISSWRGSSGRWDICCGSCRYMQRHFRYLKFYFIPYGDRVNYLVKYSPKQGMKTKWL